MSRRWKRGPEPAWWPKTQRKPPDTETEPLADRVGALEVRLEDWFANELQEAHQRVAQSEELIDKLSKRCDELEKSIESTRRHVQTVLEKLPNVATIRETLDKFMVDTTARLSAYGRRLENLETNRKSGWPEHQSGEAKVVCDALRFRVDKLTELFKKLESRIDVLSQRKKPIHTQDR